MSEIDESNIAYILDTLSLNYCSTFENLLESKLKLQSILSFGFINLAKARYSMGISSISSLQYNINDLDTALFHVDTSYDKEHGSVQFVKSGTNQLNQLNSDVTNSNVIRRRLKNNDTSTTKNQNEPNLSEKGKDPLKWFGVLVPGSLRQSQKDFNDALVLVTEISTLQAKLISIKHEFEANLERTSIIDN